jgi:predicted TPR repeat methyltransferase
MKNPDDFNVSNIYSYESSKDLKKYYDDWAHEYDAYVEEVNYILPMLVAGMAASYLDDGLRVGLDVGAGTGLIGEHLLDIKPNVLLHASDISHSMLEIARSKKTKFLSHCYTKSILIDLKDSSNLETEYYDFVVSAGTFTLGHLNFEDFTGILRCLKPGGFGVISIKKDHYDNEFFENKLKTFTKIILLNQTSVNSYNSDYEAESILVSFLKKPI